MCQSKLSVGILVSTLLALFNATSAQDIDFQSPDRHSDNVSAFRENNEGLFATPMLDVAPQVDDSLSAVVQQDSTIGQSPGDNPTDQGGSSLAQQSQNPIADLASLPLQNNFDFGISPSNRTRFVGNLQPVVPLKLNENWNLIARTVVPFVNVPTGPVDRSHGIGDSFGQFFFVPRKSGPLTWGVGPSVLMPTASNPNLGFQEWGVGVDGVALVTKGPVVAGALVNQIWSTEGSTKPFLFQPFANYNFDKGWFVTASGEFQADWERSAASRWTNVLGGGFGRTFPLFGQPVTMTARFAPYLDKPPGGPDWQFRFQMTLLFPKK